LCCSIANLDTGEAVAKSINK